MARLETPVCEFDWQAADYSLLGTDGKQWSLQDCRGSSGLLVMFICNHCPFVKAIQQALVRDTQILMSLGIGCVAIMSNDPDDYPEDSFENMQKVAKDFAYPFPYLFDQDQEIAKSYGAVCTPDFFGFNSDLKLQYRGRFDETEKNANNHGSANELLNAMSQIAKTGKGPEKQIPSIGCSIKWRHE